MKLLRRFFTQFGIIKGAGIISLALIAILFLIVYLAVCLSYSYTKDAIQSFKRKSVKKRLVHA